MGQPSFWPPTSWANFYVIVGSSAGALTGLQFVVITLVTQARRPARRQDLRAFGTPTVVHFCATLLLSAIMTAPWPSTANLDIGLAIFSGLGFTYALIVLRHARKAAYKADVEDWLWYGILPLAAYAVLGAAAILLRREPMWSFFAIAATALVLLFIGIHNAWDTVTYLAVHHTQGMDKTENNG